MRHCALGVLGAWALALPLVALTAPGGLASAQGTGPVTFTNQLLTSFTGTAVSEDYEPALRVATDGTIYLAANYRNTTAPSGVYAVELFSGPFGSPLASDGLMLPTAGGLDVDLSVSSTGNVYDATIYSPTVNSPTGAFGVGFGACPAGSVPSDMPACYQTQKLDISHTDRTWTTATGPTTVYVSYHDGSSAGQIDVARSADAGLTWSFAEAIAPALRAKCYFNNLLGPVVTDPATGDVYQVFACSAATHKGTEFNENYVYMAVSTDGGQIFTDHLVFQAPAGARLNNFWPVDAVDGAGNVYAGWSDGHDVWAAASTDHGVTWSPPIKVSQDSGSLRTSVEPYLYGGADGHLAVVWYGSADSDNMDPAAVWNVYFAQVRGATTATAAISQTVVTPHPVLVGPLCTEGLACPAGTRHLFDDFEVALNSLNRLAAIAYMDASDPANRYRVAVAWQTGGPGL